MVILIWAEWRFSKSSEFETIFRGTSAWTPILLEQFQTNTGFNTEHESTSTFTSRIGSSISTFKDMYLLNCVKKTFSKYFLYNIHHIDIYAYQIYKK